MPDQDAPRSNPAPPRPRFAHAYFLAGVAAVAALLQWIATSPRWLVHINWDAGSYLHQVANGGILWSSPTWTAHAGLQYLYLTACAVARVVHGTPADGFRLLNVVCFSLSAAFLADAGVRLARNRLLAALLVGVWATAFVTQFLTFTLEDNIVFLTPGVIMLWLFAARFEHWRSRDSLASGVLAAASLLLSIQGVLYILPPLYLAVALPRRGVTLPRRAADAALVLLGFAIGLCSFALFFAAISSLTWRNALAWLSARPTSTFPSTPAGLIAQLLDVKASLRTVGIAVSLHLFQNQRPLASPAALVGLGAVTMAGQVGMAAVATWWSLRTKRWASHLFAVLLLGMTLLTALYRDVEYAYLKRTDFVPMIMAFLVLAAAGATSLSARKQRLLVVALGAMLVWQVATGLRWRSHEVATYETLDNTVLGGRRTPGYHGLPPEGSFLRHFRSLREKNPRACAFVFDLPEVQHGRWNPDLSGSLWSEIPQHYVLVAPSAMNAWPRRLRALDPGHAGAALSGCEWLSESAKRRLGMVLTPR
jgi:hypothetical protein